MESMILAILQARYSSSRLPGKVLKPILGKPILLHQIERIQNSEMIIFKDQPKNFPGMDATDSFIGKHRCIDSLRAPKQSEGKQCNAILRESVTL